MSFKNNRILKFALKLSISLAFAAWLVFKMDWSEVLSYAGALSVWQVALYLAVVLSGMLISARKWQILARGKGMEFSMKELFAYYLAGTFINNFMPSVIGGDTYRAYSLGRKNGQYAQSAGTVVMDRITGLLGLMLLALLFSLLNWREISSHAILYFLALAMAAGMLGLFLVEEGSKTAWGKGMSSSLPAKAREFIKILHEYYLDRRLFGAAMSFSISFALVGVAAANYVLFRSLGISMDIPDYLSVIFLISIISAIPVSINNIGIKEWAYVTFFGFFGVASSAAVAVALISRILQMLLSFLALPFYLKHK